jgi:glycerol uptake facilitator-like aquaporin
LFNVFRSFETEVFEAEMSCAPQPSLHRRLAAEGLGTGFLLVAVVEFVVTFSLIGLVWTCSRTRPSSIAGVVAAYIGGAFWFTATDFANPAVTCARALTNTFSGIRPVDVPGFIAAEIVGAVAAVVVFRWLADRPRPVTPGRAQSRRR